MLPSMVRRWLNRPKKSDPRLLAKFFYVDEEVSTIVHELQCLDVRKDPQNYLVLLGQLHNSQERMLAILEQILDKCVPTKRRQRDYHLKFPDDIVNNNMTAHLLFAAELLVGGTYVEVEEADGVLLRPLAQELLQSLECLRRVLREQSLQDPGIYPESSHKAMLQYDNLCAEFELRYMSLVVSVKSPEEIYEQQEVAVLFCETVSRALQRGHLTQEMIDDCEPELMISIPRLAIISGLLIFPDGPLNLERPPEEMCELFSPFYGLLKKIREILCILTKKELFSLERALSSSSEDPSTPLPACVPTSTDASSLDYGGQSVNSKLPSANEQTFQNASWPNFSHGNIGACNNTVSGTYYPCAQQGVVAVDSEYKRSQDVKPQNGARRPAEILRNVHVRCSVRGSKLSDVRSRYRSDSDMLHRLFVCIAGVADQLQTNFASDLRVILKTVFETTSSRQQVDTQKAEHGYASILPCDTATPGRRKRQRTTSNPDSVRSVHNELEKHRRAQLRRCLEQLKQQVPLSVDTSRHTTLSLLHRARQHIKKLEDQELRAKNLKEKLRSEQQKLRQRLKQLLPSSSSERIRADSLDSSTLSSERSDSDQEDLEVDVEGVILGANDGDLFVSFSAGMEHSYSTPAHAWL